MGYTIIDKIKDIDLHLKTESEVFSPESIDKGTLAMLSCVDFKDGDKVLDLGCGYGVVGILAAKIVGSNNVVMIDKSDIAVGLSKQNAVLNGVDDIRVYQSDGFKNLNEKDFTLILSNPPYHTDFSVAKEFIEKGFNRLTIGGKMVMVTKRDLWYRKKLTSIFGGVKVSEINGYFVFMSIKKEYTYGKGKNKKDKM
jgi:16S rRNA (guanine1207-N2)-methyltransferase